MKHESLRAASRALALAYLSSMGVDARSIRHRINVCRPSIFAYFFFSGMLKSANSSSQPALENPACCKKGPVGAETCVPYAAKLPHQACGGLKE